MTFLAVAIVFTIIVLVHELGHFWAARRAGIHVVEFSIGMGPRLLHFTKGETMYSLKLFPIGGSCRMLGEDESEDDPRAFNKKPVGWRILTIAAGALLNFVLGFVISTVLVMFTSGSDTTVRDFSAVSPIQEAGVQIGDRIIRINGRNIGIYGDFFLEMQRADGSPVDIVVDRGGTLLDFTITPHDLGDRFILGFIPGNTVGPFFARQQSDGDETFYVNDLPWVHRAGFFESLANGFRQMVFSVRVVVFGLTQLITGQFSADDVLGPVGIVTVLGDEVGYSLEAGGGMGMFWAILSFTALLSVNLGVINLLPLPALDGGRLVFLFLEAIRRKPINPDKEGMVHFAGFVLLMVLIVFLTYNDIMRLVTS